jgi:hypothetical protein
MTHHFEPVLPLVRAAAIEPAACLRAALAMAELHDANGGVLKASMASLAALAGLSTPRVRKHVHALITLGVLEVTANAHGGAPGAVPHYRFNVARLRALCQQPGSTPDMFSTPVVQRRSFYAFDEGDTLVEMAVEVRGRPGKRQVRFVRPTPQGDIPYGMTYLRALLLPPFAKGAWTGWLNPQDGAPAWADDVYTNPEAVECLRQWAQAAALGRTESVVEA